MCTVQIFRNSDGHEVWGDELIAAATVADMPAAAERRIAGPVAYRVVRGSWIRLADRVGPMWMADVDIGE
jgi:hypothetical protein